MPSHRVLVIGRGHIGSFLQRYWQLPAELHWTGDLADLDGVTLARLAPDAVVNTAGKTDLAWCEANPLECFHCNTVAPLMLSRRLREALPSVPFIQLGSGCVWDGPYRRDGGPFRPTDPPIPACFYSWSKAAFDALLLGEAAGDSIILRPRQAYSDQPSPRNTLSKLCGYPALIDTPNSMTSTFTIARTVEQLLELPRGGRPKTLSVYDRGIVTPYQVGVVLAKLGLRDPPRKIDKAALDAWHRPRRVDVVLSDPIFEELVGPPEVHEEIERVARLYAAALSASTSLPPGVAQRRPTAT